MRESVDILISGGGVAGLAAAAGFGAAGYSVVIVDPAPPITEGTATGADLRTTAFLQPSLPVLRDTGLWERLEPHAMPLQVMRIVDAGGAEPEARIVHDFNAADVSEQPFGWNLPNWLLRREFVTHLARLPNVDFRPGTGTKSLFTRESEALVTLSDGAQLRAQLVIGADGRNSKVRKALGIGVSTTRYGQKALAFAVTHPEPHGNVSTEIHRSGGPFTLVPLPDHQGKPCSAVIWMETGPEIERLRNLSPEAFTEAMNTRSCGLYGWLELATPLTVWPIISQIAERWTGQRSALMAEAAHVVPPIGAQGLNMSLADLTTLLELATPETLGTPEMLQAYERRRALEVKLRQVGVDALNRASMLESRPLRDLRAGALNALYSVAPVRRSLMQLGIGMR
ncbi:UbiH/UbiF family hydroxylase [Pararhodobacter oceanensis]|uniref:UbiH/UbiF family hydroxylase n=1 Tax=Pararhodobacter oceanensis TaxID=2172121 RepID=A0A2T8HZ31_9RHOB|nr:UbiH/UbiF family hydroxylase [Pararhodobacter oceanensis]PVH30651.1 UbiH/UbiF family hydroxylase [Pararhodobacter oceanensis]